MISWAEAKPILMVSMAANNIRILIEVNCLVNCGGVFSAFIFAYEKMNLDNEFNQTRF